MKKIISVMLVLALAASFVFLMGACGEKTEETPDASVTDTAGTTEHPRVKITMQNGKSFVMELYPEYAPETVANFLSLVESGFYDGVGFHRVVEGFMAQGGDPTGTGNGDSGKTIKGEFAQNGFTQNTLSHTRGVVSMARSNSFDSASCQFFICYDDCSASLDGGYAAFGKVIEGMDVVDDFNKVKKNYNSIGELASPAEPIIMAKAEKLDSVEKVTVGEKHSYTIEELPSITLPSNENLMGKKFDSWSEAYEDYILGGGYKEYIDLLDAQSEKLKAGEAKKEICACLRDMDADGVPELMLCDDNIGVEMSYVLFFSFVDGKVNFLNFTPFSELKISADKKYPGVFTYSTFDYCAYFSLAGGECTMNDVASHLSEKQIVIESEELYKAYTSTEKLEPVGISSIETGGWAQFVSSFGF